MLWGFCVISGGALVFRVSLSLASPDRMPAQLILAIILAVVWNTLAVINSRIALWSDIAFFRRRRPAVALRRRCAELGHTLVDVWRETCARVGDKKVCVVCAESSRSFTFATVDRESNRLARWALEAGLRAPAAGRAGSDAAGAAPADAVVGVMLDSSIESVVFVLGLLKAGMAVALVDADLRGARLAAALRSARARALIVSGALEGALDGVGGELAAAGVQRFVWAPERADASPSAHPSTAIALAPLLARAGTAPVDNLAARAAVRAASPCLLVGGEAAGEWVTLSHAGFIALAADAAADCALRPSDVLYCGAGLGGAGGGGGGGGGSGSGSLEACALGLGGALVGGHSVVVRRAFALETFWADCAAYGCTAALHAGAALARLAARAPAASDSAHCVRVLIGPSVVGQRLCLELGTRFHVPVACALHALADGAGGALVLASACERAKSSGAGAAAAIGWLRAREGRFALVRTAADGRGPERSAAADAGARAMCIPCARGEPGLLLVRSDADAAAVDAAGGGGGPAAGSAASAARLRDVVEVGDSFVSTGLLARHDRFGGWLWLLARAAEPTRAFPLAVARALGAAPGVADACAFGFVAGGGSAAAGARVCCVALATPDGGAPDVAQLARVLHECLPKPEGKAKGKAAAGDAGGARARAPLVLRHVQVLERDARSGEARTAALAARGVEGDDGTLWWWDEASGELRPLDAAARARLASGELRLA
jgi:hypothetical protein